MFWNFFMCVSLNFEVSRRQKRIIRDVFPSERSRDRFVWKDRTVWAASKRFTAQIKLVQLFLVLFLWYNLRTVVSVCETSTKKGLNSHWKETLLDDVFMQTKDKNAKCCSAKKFQSVFIRFLFRGNWWVGSHPTAAGIQHPGLEFQTGEHTGASPDNGDEQESSGRSRRWNWNAGFQPNQDFRAGMYCSEFSPVLKICEFVIWSLPGWRPHTICCQKSFCFHTFLVLAKIC